MQGSVEKMDRLISDLLRYATIGRQDLQFRAVPLQSALDAALALADTEIAQRRAEIVVCKPLPSVVGDPTLLQVILQNLIGNAIKFVAPEVRPRVEIDWRNGDPSSVALTITDNGVGIPAGARARIFGMFERFHPEHEGTGIGLPIVHRAVERLGGRIAVEDAPRGTGTRFVVELPAV